MIRGVDGHDVDAVDARDRARRATPDKPTLICCKTIIGKGAPNLQGSDKVHGAALGDKEIAADARDAGLDPSAVRDPGRRLRRLGRAQGRAPRVEDDWNEQFAAYRAAVSAAKRPNCERRMKGELPANFDETVLAAVIAACVEKKETIATRKASQNAIQALAPVLPEFLGGSADLTGSNLTNWKESVAVRAGQPGNHINYGVREFGMSAIMNGIALHGGFIPFGATFLTFSDYSRNALRMAALMKIALAVRVHPRFDRPGRRRPDAPVGRARVAPAPDPEPGQLASVRHGRVRGGLGGMRVKRKDGPSTLIFSRQNLPFQQRSDAQMADIARGGYVLRDAPDAKVILIATGSEVELAVKAADALAAAGHRGARRVDAVAPTCSTARTLPTRPAC